MFLRALGIAGAGAIVAACSESDSANQATPTSPSATPTFDPVGMVTDADEVLSVTAATYEQLVGESVPLAFGVLDASGSPVVDADIEVHVIPLDGEPSGPFAASSVDDPTGRGGLYLAELPFVEPVFTSIVAVTGDGLAGSATIPVATAETSALPAPGDEAPAVATPTAAASLGAEQLCTQEPPCGMHEISLDAALAEGRPVVLQFATPAYCQTAVCGPSVAVLDEVRQSADWGDTAFIHCEIYADAGQTLLEPVTAEGWNLPSEPWLYTIDASGRIVARSDGPLLTIPEQVQRMVESVA